MRPVRGRRSADDTIMDLAAAGAQAAGGGPAAGARVLVVTDDRGLRARLAATGARTVPLTWLTNRLELPRLASPAPGNRRPSIAAGQPAGAGADADGAEGPRWKPGRGATAKTGPAHKVARHRRPRRLMRC
jgi:hypothetical protein